MTILPATDGIELAMKVLRDGGVIAHATETCYGFACDLKNPNAVKTLFAIKNRPLDQPVSALFSSLEEAKKYVEWNNEAQRLADKHLPGPLTVILQQKSPAVLIPSPVAGLTLGVRISSHPIATKLAKRFGSPLSTTSANLHGQPNPYSVDDIDRQFSGQKFQPDLILDSGVLPQNPPSTVIDLTRPDGSVVRKGSVQPPKK